ncbi:MAG TPA: DUF2339 domain-containing protein, partial [Chloroflexia bacterium]|nr:DUF2339 domain-containing protein [Chloroflexia bacterium]
PAEAPPPPGAFTQRLDAIASPAALRLAGARFDFLGSTEFWFNKLGIGLLLFGVASLFKYSVDQGAEFRGAVGLLIGIGLLALGLRLNEDRPQFSQVLLGGSIGAFYITGYAAFQVFHPRGVPYEAVLAFMILITCGVFTLSARQNAAMLALIGTIGGLAAPFVLHKGPGSLAGLAVYTSIILTGTSAIYFYRGWHALLWTAFTGVWGVFMFGSINGFPGKTDLDPEAVQAGVILAGIGFWAIPVARDLLRTYDPRRGPQPAPRWLARLVRPDLRPTVDPHVHLLTILTPCFALGMTNLIWSLPKDSLGLVTLGVAGLYGLAYRLLRRHDTHLAYTHGLMATVLLTLALVLMLQGDGLFFALAVEGTAIHCLAHRLGNRLIALAGHLMFVPVAPWLTARVLTLHLGLVPFTTGPALSDLAVIGLIGGVAAMIQPWRLAWAYRSFAQIAFFAWLWRELLPLPHGDAYIILSVALAALLFHLLAARQMLRPTGGQADTLVPHLALILTGAWLALRLLLFPATSSLLGSASGLCDLGVIAVIWAASRLVQPREVATGYQLYAQLAVFGWLWRELHGLANGDTYLFLAIGGYATLLHILAHRQSDRGVTLPLAMRPTALVAHLGFAIIGVWLPVRILTGAGVPPIFNLGSLIDLAVIGLAATAGRLLPSQDEWLAYQYGVHLTTLAWLGRELHGLVNGDGYVLLAWGVYAIGLQIQAQRSADEGIQLLRYILSVAIAGGLIFRLAQHAAVLSPVFAIPAIQDLALIGLVFLAALLEPRKSPVVWIYRVLGHSALAAWLVVELIRLPGDGPGLMAVAAGCYGLLLLAGARRAATAPTPAAIGDRPADVGGSSSLLMIPHPLPTSYMPFRAWLPTDKQLTAARSSKVMLSYMGGHLLFAILSGPWLVWRVLTLHHTGIPILNVWALDDLAVIGLIVVAARLVAPREQILYQLSAHGAFLGWSLRELLLIPQNGNGYVTVVWGIYALLLFLIGLRGNQRIPLYAGAGTLLLVVGKLIVVDLAAVDQSWRILLFLGFGGLFLGLSYYMQSWMKQEVA